MTKGQSFSHESDAGYSSGRSALTALTLVVACLLVSCQAPPQNEAAGNGEPRKVAEDDLGESYPLTWGFIDWFSGRGGACQLLIVDASRARIAIFDPSAGKQLYSAKMDPSVIAIIGESVDVVPLGAVPSGESYRWVSIAANSLTIGATDLHTGESELVGAIDRMPFVNGIGSVSPLLGALESGEIVSCEIRESGVVIGWYGELGEPLETSVLSLGKPSESELYSMATFSRGDSDYALVVVGVKNAPSQVLLAERRGGVELVATIVHERSQISGARLVLPESGGDGAFVIATYFDEVSGAGVFRTAPISDSISGSPIGLIWDHPSVLEEYGVAEHISTQVGPERGTLMLASRMFDAQGMLTAVNASNSEVLWRKRGVGKSPGISSSQSDIDYGLVMRGHPDCGADCEFSYSAIVSSGPHYRQDGSAFFSPPRADLLDVRSGDSSGSLLLGFDTQLIR